MKKLIAVCAVVAVMVVGLAACSSGSSDSGGSGGSNGSGSATGGDIISETVFTEGSAGYYEAVEGTYASGVHRATVTVTGYDPFTIEMNADAAPVTVANFCTLANEGYYNGLAFYRIVDGFCLQGGTQGNTASGKDASLTPIIGEFAGNGVENPMADDFKKGVVAMARTQDPNSATSTIFVTLGSGASVQQSLNGQYAAFGTIDDAGMAVVDQIVADYLPYATGNMGVINDQASMPIIESVVIED